MANRKKNWARDNIRDLVVDQNMSLKQLAAACGFNTTGYKWVRRVTSSGLIHVQKSGQERLDKISEFISARYPRTSSLGRLEYLQPISVREALLNDDLLLFLKRFQLPRRDLQSLRQVVESRGPLCSNSEAVSMRKSLVESGKFDYLKIILTDLHRSYFG